MEVASRKFVPNAGQISLATREMGAAIAAFNIPIQDAILFSGAIAEIMGGRASKAGRRFTSAMSQMAKNLDEVQLLLGKTEEEIKAAFDQDVTGLVFEVLKRLDNFHQALIDRTLRSESSEKSVRNLYSRLLEELMK